LASGVLVGGSQGGRYFAAPPGQDLASRLKPKDRSDRKAPPLKVEEQGLTPVPSPIPDRYRDPATSGLTFVIGKGHNTYDVDLKGPR
jgi:hypothetical protein